jgi:hypothetical protein
MKKQNWSCWAWLSIALAVLSKSLMDNAPGGAGWPAFVADESPNFEKLLYLAGIYLWPLFLSFCAIALFQLQFRLSMGGAGAPAVFAVSVLGSSAMLSALRGLSAASAPSYILGMALGYTVAGRVYAVYLRAIWKRIRVPCIVWRGNTQAVREINDRIGRKSGPS